ncbi:MAG: serine/threonine protein kinase [Gemmataceae bacterium]|nr:serine/threonine protein kinase [Gemmataceae bacterium]
MNSRLQQSSLATIDRETVLQPAANAGARAKVCCPKREIVDGSGPHLTKETQALLRLRLRASAFILLIGFGVFLVRHVVGVLTGESFDPLLLTVHVLVVLVLTLCTLPLCRQCSVCIRKLRIAELIIYGLPAVFFLLLQHRFTLRDADRGYMTPTMAFWLLLIFTYAMFIPNTWRRAALVIANMALAPVALLAGMMLAYPQVAEITTVVGFVQHVLVMKISAIGAVFGTHLINTLRREAFEAKQIGQYRLIELLGVGGMGEVHLAEHRMLKRPCAVKLIRAEQAGDPQALARFEREVQMTAQLSHWNTIEIYDYGRTEDGTFYYVMEYLPGLSLEELLDRHGPLPAKRVIHLLRQTCQGLREAHAIGLIHRDIKPGNIFVSQRGGLFDVAKLLDFGLVKPVAEIPSARLTQEGAISGTPLFMSPEQARGLGEVDARSDIYSLGAVAYTLLSGRPPFEQASPFEVMIAHARDDVVPPSKLQPDVPADLEAIIVRCLAKSPEDRFQDAESLEQALAECAAADQWTQANATRWWQENEQTAADRHELGRSFLSEPTDKHFHAKEEERDVAATV